MPHHLPIPLDGWPFATAIQTITVLSERQKMERERKRERERERKRER
jgi:hypothetical protein